MKIKQRIVMYL